MKFILYRFVNAHFDPTESFDGSSLKLVVKKVKRFEKNFVNYRE